MSAKMEIYNGRPASLGPDAPEGKFILRDGCAIAEITDGKVVMLPEYERFKIQARKFWKDYQAGPTVALEPTCPQGVVPVLHIPSPLDTVTEAGFVKHDDGSMFPKPFGNFEKGDPLKDIPPAPEQDPAAGSKTPAYAEWMRTYHPAKWAELHKNWSGK